MNVKGDMMSNLFCYKNSCPDANSHIREGLCKCLAYKSKIPPNIVKSPKAWYMSNVSTEVRKVLAIVNEKLYIDINNYDNTIYEIWRIRYNLLHDTMKLTDSSLTILRNGSTKVHDSDSLRLLNSITNIFNSHIEAQ